LGVLVDDLITKGVSEPYRMFTSRAEFRLQLREDNADARLTEAGRKLCLVDDVRWDAFCRKRDAVSRETERLRSLWVGPKNLTPADSERVFGKPLEHEYSLADLLRRPDVSYAKLMTLVDGLYASPELGAAVPTEAAGHGPEGASFVSTVLEQVEISAKYSGYINRQRDEVARAAYFENLRLPLDLDYMQVSALSIEARQKLNRHKPETLGQASRISGITPASVSLLLIHLKKNSLKDLATGASPETTGQEVA
jgi:tRNA uridine 5-carboxymethylaminomethyl modification enzyme